MITLQDAAVASWPEGNKKPKTRQLHSTAGMGAMSGIDAGGYLSDRSASERVGRITEA